MTREEAKAFLISISHDLGTVGAECLSVKDGKKMRDAIETLEQEPCEKTQMIDKSNFSQEQYRADLQSAFDCGKASAEPCEDCVSLRDVIRTIDWWVYYREPDCRQLVIWLKERINELPPVTSKQKMGKWEWVQYDSNPEIGNFHCSECNFIPASFNWASKHLNYCPNCGAKMEVEE